MSNILTDWRQALMTLLDSDLQGGDFTVLAGRRDGVSRDRKLAVVFTPRFTPDRDIYFARPPLIVRAWWPRPKEPKPTVPLDPEPLEQLAIDLVTLLQPVRTTLTPNLYFEVESVEIDYDEWGVQLTLVSWIVNPGTIPA